MRPISKGKTRRLLRSAKVRSEQATARSASVPITSRRGRVTDHRIGLTLYKIEQIMNGDLDEIIDALVTADQAERMKTATSE